MDAVPEPSVYEVPSLQAQDMQEETSSSSRWEDLTEKVASTFCEGNFQESKSRRQVAKKRLKHTRVNEEGQPLVDFKIEKLQSSRGALERRSTGVSIMEEGITKNVKAEDGYISSVLPVKTLEVSRTSRKGEHHFQDVIIIEDDDDDENDAGSELNLEDLTSDSEGDHDDALTLESDASSSENPRSLSSQSIGQRLNHNGHATSSSDPTNYFNNKDDCQIFRTGNLYTSLRSMKRVHRQKSSGKEPADHYTDVSESATSSSSDTDSSDCEIMEGSCGKIRQQWETAALKKRVAKGVKFRGYVVEEEASASGSNLEPNSLFREFEREGKEERPDANLQDHYADHCSADPPDLASTSGIVYTSGQEDVTSPITMNKSEIPNSGVETSDGVSLGQSTNTVEVKPLREENECAKNSFGIKMKEVLELAHPKSHQGAKKSLKSTSGGAKKVSAMMEKLSGWEGDREKMKETAEFKRAEQEEWARRHLELQRQAEEARRLSKRKRAEVTRKVEMERRQKQRLEEMRENQKKDEETTHLKDQLRVQVRAKLEQVASQCKDMASLLRHLGIPVEGGAFPFSQQVNAAYKQALLRFHPDRASKGGLRPQVEAEETFKLISRLKDTLLPVSPMSLKRTSWQ